MISKKIRHFTHPNGFIDNRAGGVELLRQSLLGLWVEIVAQVEKLLSPYPARQSQQFSTFSEPLTQNAVALAVIIAKTKVFLKVLLGVNEAVFHFADSM